MHSLLTQFPWKGGENGDYDKKFLFGDIIAASEKHGVKPLFCALLRAFDWSALLTLVSEQSANSLDIVEIRRDRSRQSN